jgi:hypothetical protein
MPIPDICLSKGTNDSFSAIGGTDSISGGLPDTGVITSGGDVSVVGTIGNMSCNRPVLSGIAHSRRTFTIQFKKPNGTVVNLTNVAKVTFQVKEMQDSIKFYINKECTIADASTGIITLSLSPRDIPYAGVWNSAFLLWNADDELLIQYDVYFYLEKDLNSSERTNTPITISEVRMLLLDRAPADNSLLDDFEFSDAEIVFAIRRPVDEWNEMLPQIEGYQFTPATFPYRYNWMNAAASELLRMASRKLIRNKLDYNAGGLSVNDKARGPVYAQLAEQMHLEWTAWCRHEKARINAENCYGSITSNIYY